MCVMKTNNGRFFLPTHEPFHFRQKFLVYASNVFIIWKFSTRQSKVWQRLVVFRTNDSPDVAVQGSIRVLQFFGTYRHYNCPFVFGISKTKLHKNYITLNFQQKMCGGYKNQRITDPINFWEEYMFMMLHYCQTAPVMLFWADDTQSQIGVGSRNTDICWKRNEQMFCAPSRTHDVISDFSGLLSIEIPYDVWMSVKLLSSLWHLTQDFVFVLWIRLPKRENQIVDWEHILLRLFLCVWSGF